MVVIKRRILKRSNNLFIVGKMTVALLSGTSLLRAGVRSVIHYAWLHKIALKTNFKNETSDVCVLKTRIVWTSQSMRQVSG